MKIINFVAIIIALLFVENVKAQDCKVLVAALEGKYTGDCKKDKADGMGKAVGTDQYEGSFSAGLPDGKGKYTWKNGDIYDGAWKKGKREGEGTFTKTDGTVTKGFWAKDVYAGLFEKPFVVKMRSSNMTSIDAKRDMKDTGQFITIEIENTASSGGVSKPEIVIREGFFAQMQDVMSSKRGKTVRLTGVTFPFKARIRIDKEEADVEYLEAGAWTTKIVVSGY